MPKAKLEVKLKKVKKEVIKKPAVSRQPKAAVLSVPMYALEGKEAGVLDLPEVLFGAKVNKQLLTQAIRVYLNNLRGHWSNTKTRSQVQGSTHKIYRQKGTGGARHGSKRAPIFVGGGIALGPKFRKTVLELPKKMKKASLAAALSSKVAENEVFGFKDGDKVTGKTAQMRVFLDKIQKGSVLFVTDQKSINIAQAVRNLPGINALPAEQVSTLEIIRHKTIFFTKEAVERLEERGKKQKVEEGK